MITREFQPQTVRMADRKITVPAADDTQVVDPPLPRTSTTELPVEPIRTEVDFDSPDQVADILTHIGRLIRERRRVIITIE